MSPFKSMKKEIVETIIKKCLGYKKDENLLIVCDDKRRALSDGFYKVAQSLGVDCVLLNMAPRKMHGQEPPKLVAEAMKGADLAVLLTTMSLSHTKARKDACKKFGARIASLPGVTKDMLERAIMLDYSALKENVASFSRMLTKGNKLKVLTKKGTNLEMSIKGRKGFDDDGLYTKRGDFGNLPAGEACIGPLEGTASGRLVIDGSAPLAGRLKRPLEIIVKDGYAKDIPVPALSGLVKKYGKNVLNIAEFGIGLNPKAKVTGAILEDEKVMNTAHVALGNNVSFGGRVSCPCHLDFVFFDPEIYVDGKKIR